LGRCESPAGEPESAAFPAASGSEGGSKGDAR
jgi:hypothetical protein